ncbi:hypothetical protein IS360_003592 [Salmonella enterica]|nr:hypothetical protein [Salmonella enterica]
MIKKLNKEYIEEQARNDAALRFEIFQIKTRSDEIFKQMKIDNGYESDDKKIEKNHRNERSKLMGEYVAIGYEPESVRKWIETGNDEDLKFPVGVKVSNTSLLEKVGDEMINYFKKESESIFKEKGSSCIGGNNANALAHAESSPKNLSINAQAMIFAGLVPNIGGGK